MRRATLLLALYLGALGGDLALDSYGPGPAEAGPAGAGLLRSFLGNLSYEVRGTLARLVYLKLDRYIHEGKKLDFGNGVMGLTMVGNTEIVPLYGLVTFLDPHFIEAFSLGGEHLIYGLGKAADGVELLETGLRCNPDNPLTSELLGQLGVYHLKDQGLPRRAIERFLQARELRRQLPDDQVSQGFIFSVPQLNGLLAMAYYRAGESETARRWLEQPNLLEADSSLFAALGVPPPPSRLPASASSAGNSGAKAPPADEHEAHEHQRDGEEALHGQRWLDATRMAALRRQLAWAAAGAGLLALPLAAGALRRRRSETAGPGR
jgi:tetratricopeptide (TPR) repeat protein